MKSVRRLCIPIAILGLAPCVAAASQATTAAPATTHALTPELAEATFIAAWEAMRDSGALSSMSEEDWEDLRNRFEQPATDARTNAELRAVLEQMIEVIGKSHFSIIPGDMVATTEGDAAPGEGNVGIDARFVGDSAIVVAVTPDSSAARAGIVPGWTIDSIRDRDLGVFSRGFGDIESASMSGYHRNAALQAMLTATPSATIQLALTDTEGTEHDFDLEAELEPGTMVRFGNLPPMSVSTNTRILDQKQLAELGIRTNKDFSAGVIEFNVWMVPIMQPIAEAIERFRDADVDCIIFDIRGNPGGVGGLAMGVGGHFLEEPTSLGTMTNAYGELHFNTNPQVVSASGKLVEPLDMPLFIIVDEMSASTSEIFAGGMQEATRATVVGRRTPGLALPAVASDLPNGDIFYHAIASFDLPSGRVIEGVGISPDLAVPLDARSFEASSDPDLHAALEWLAREKAADHAPEAVN